MPTRAIDSGLRGLYAVTPDGLAADLLLERARAALAGGVRLLQYRDKSSSATQRRDVALALRDACHATGARLIVNDDVALAVEAGADGVHLGRDDLAGATLAQVRARLPAGAIIGVSCYADLDRAATAVAAGADYIAFGSAFPSRTKPNAVPLPPTTLAAARARFDVPIVVIGGIRVDNATTLIEAGADMLAVVSDLFDAADITARARAYLPLFTARNPA